MKKLKNTLHQIKNRILIQIKIMQSTNKMMIKQNDLKVI